MIETTTYARKSFDVEAVRVTEENINEVAEWCDGEVKHTQPKPGRESNPYVKVKVFRPMGERQTRAYIGDWVLQAGSGFKVYPDKAFQTCFDEPVIAELVEDEFEDTVTYDEATLTKVKTVLLDAFNDAQQAADAITNLQNQGILFRERATTKEN